MGRVQKLDTKRLRETSNLGVRVLRKRFSTGTGEGHKVQTQSRSTGIFLEVARRIVKTYRSRAIGEKKETPEKEKSLNSFPGNKRSGTENN